VSARSPLEPHEATAAELQERIAAERRSAAFLIYRDDAGKQQIVELGSEHITVGRRLDNDVPLGWDREVSRLHAQIQHIGGDWCLVDEGLSRNGSYVNGHRVVGKRRLRDGDRLCFGSTLVAYRAPAKSEFESTLAPPAALGSVTLSDAQRKVLIELCRPLADSAFATPATNRAIADELALSVDAVKAHLRVLFERFDLTDLPQNEKRAKLAATALLSGVVAPREL
jgi:hypothetical protein